jgi:hypothetical protein
LGDDAVIHVCDALGVLDDAVVMRDDEHGTLRCHGGTGEQLHDGLARLVIECRGGLITNDKFGFYN